MSTNEALRQAAERMGKGCGMTTKDQSLALALQALEATLETLDCANAEPGGPIADTIWHTESETLFDYLSDRINVIRKAIDTSGQRVEELQGREHETAQQPAMRRATREEKISNPRVYEVPVGTPPPENKPWVGLTPEDIAGAPDNPIALIAYIEAKLREKNGGAA